MKEKFFPNQEGMELCSSMIMKKKNTAGKFEKNRIRLAQRKRSVEKNSQVFWFRTIVTTTIHHQPPTTNHQPPPDHLHHTTIHSLKPTANAPENRPSNPQKERIIFQPPTFRCKLAVSFRVTGNSVWNLNLGVKKGGTTRGRSVDTQSLLDFGELFFLVA